MFACTHIPITNTPTRSSYVCVGFWMCHSLCRIWCWSVCIECGIRWFVYRQVVVGSPGWAPKEVVHRAVPRKGLFVISAMVVQHGLPPVLPIIPLTMFVHYQVHRGMDVVSCSKHVILVYSSTTCEQPQVAWQPAFLHSNSIVPVAAHAHVVKFDLSAQHTRVVSHIVMQTAAMWAQGALRVSCLPSPWHGHSWNPLWMATPYRSTVGG